MRVSTVHASLIEMVTTSGPQPVTHSINTHPPCNTNTNDEQDQESSSLAYTSHILRVIWRIYVSCSVRCSGNDYNSHSCPSYEFKSCLRSQSPQAPEVLWCVLRITLLVSLQEVY